jgi:hypothetical protein
MTHAERILRAVGALTRQGRQAFARVVVRDAGGVDRAEWAQSVGPVFQAMRVDHPGGAPPIGERWRGAFRRVARGRYELTTRGRALLRELGELGEG